MMKYAKTISKRKDKNFKIIGSHNVIDLQQVKAGNWAINIAIAFN